MSVRATVDSSGAKARLRAYRNSRTPALRTATAEMGGIAARFIVENGPKDTNRFVRGVALAHNDIAQREGVALLPVPPLMPSKRKDEIGVRLTNQAQRTRANADRLAGWQDEMERRPGFKATWPSYRKLVREARQAERIAQRAKKELEDFANAENAELAVLIGGRGTAKGRGQRFPRTVRQLQTIRLKVYGGSGRVFETAGKAFYELTNKEPHARIVERNTRIGARAAGVVASAGLRRASNAYLRSLGTGVIGTAPTARRRA